MAAERFEVVDHTADWALRVFGRDLEQLLIHAAQGMNSLLISETADLPEDVVRHITLEAYDAESLLVEWLTELAFWAEREQIIFQRFDLFEVTPTHLRATIWGGRAPELQKHIKAVTYHELEIIKTDSGVEATVVFDV